MTNTTFDDSDVWFGDSMHNVNWPEVVKEVAPFLSFRDRITLLEISGTDAMSPALLLSAAVYYKNEKQISFRNHIQSMSVRLMEAFFNSTTRSAEQKDKENDATHAISLFVGKDAKQMNEFIAILKSVKIEAFKYQETTNEISSNDQRISRGAGDETTLRFPYKMSECWMFSATHHSNEQCSVKSCPKSAIDLAPNLFMGFGFEFSYFKSQGEVVAAHSGVLDIVSQCKLSVKSLQFTTFYSHIKINPTRTSGEYVKAGDSLGFIALDRQDANCNCEVEAGRTECSTGPHLHWEVRDKDNRPIDLDGMVVNGFKIHTGSDSYDFGCGKENCWNGMSLDDIEQSCSTVYRRLVDNVTFCPSVQGANWGKY